MMNYKEIIDNLPKEPNRYGIWTDGEEVLCREEMQAEHIADFLESLGFVYVRTGYYDDEVIDSYTGYYYASVD